MELMNDYESSIFVMWREWALSTSISQISVIVRNKSVWNAALRLMYWVIDSPKSPATTTIELKTFNWLRMKAKEQKLNVSAFFPQPICEVGLVMRQVILDRCCFEVLNTVSPYPMIYLSTNLCSINQMNANLLWRHVIRKQVRREDVRNFLVDRKIGLAFIMTLSWICDEAF